MKSHSFWAWMDWWVCMKEWMVSFMSTSMLGIHAYIRHLNCMKDVTHHAYTIHKISTQFIIHYIAHKFIYNFFFPVPKIIARIHCHFLLIPVHLQCYFYPFLSFPMTTNVTCTNGHDLVSLWPRLNISHWQWNTFFISQCIFLFH